ncbi:MAG: hypothetical protein HYV63_29890 [Candidatus Schekmanbacteria bacterium]|nr:hypothetical protein [Candidatus Schekmanbacteria bacterium]
MGDEYERRRLAEWQGAEMARATGRAYRIDRDRLDTASLRELQRLVRNLDGEHRMALQRARLCPWRTP